jgi:hypothetical protein
MFLSLDAAITSTMFETTETHGSGPSSKTPETGTELDEAIASECAEKEESSLLAVKMADMVLAPVCVVLERAW